MAVLSSGNLSIDPAGVPDAAGDQGRAADLDPAVVLLVHPEQSPLADADGLVAVGGVLTPERLVHAYRHGIFPFFDEQSPVLWWSPDPRAIFELNAFHVPHSLAKVLRKGLFQITLDRAFAGVMAGCAAPGPGRRSTWITPEFLEAYEQLHRLGHAHRLGRVVFL